MLLIPQANLTSLRTFNLILDYLQIELLTEKADEFLEKSLLAATDDPFFNQFEPGCRVGKIAKDIIVALKNCNGKTFSCYLAKIVYHILKHTKGIRHEDKEKAFTGFYVETVRGQH